jgi:hypothetical protein
MVCTKCIDTLKGHHFSGYKVIFASYGAWKYVVVDLNAKVSINLMLKTPFHNVVTTKFVPLDLGGDLPKPPRMLQ